MPTSERPVSGPAASPTTHDQRSYDGISSFAPLRLERAAEIAFPFGDMTGKGLRREADRGRLVIEKINGRYFTTLAAIEEMRKLCRVNDSRHDSGSGPRAANAPPYGSSSTEGVKSALAAARMMTRELRERSATT